jgi:hypothetical protein
MEFEFTRMAVLFVHLIACCVAIGMVLTSDIAMVRQLVVADPNNRLDPEHLSQLQKTVSAALWMLWMTGVVLVSLDVYLKGWNYLSNPKLQSKVAIVMLLTLNGFALHKYVLPLMQKAGSLLHLSFSQRVLTLFSGAVSGVSWLYAAMLGIGRPLNFKYSLFEILAAYPVLIAGGFVAMLVLTAWAQYQASGEARAFEGTKVMWA